MSLSLKLQPSVPAHVPGVSARSLTMVAPKATPIVLTLFRPAAATALTAVPWPPWSLTPRLPATSPLATSILPANSARFGLMPLSTIPILIPAPLAPVL
jgi:hypothetical protein